MRRASLLVLGGACAACSGAAPEADPLAQRPTPQAPVAFEAGTTNPGAAAFVVPAHRAGRSIGFARRKPRAASPQLAFSADMPATKLRVLVVPALFSDSAAPGASRESIGDALFGIKSVARFYEQQSRGALAVEGEVTPWLRSSTSMSDALGTEHGFGSDARLGEHLEDVILQAAAQTNLRDFDNDGLDGVPSSQDDDGRVDLVIVLFSELGAPCGGNGPWGHRSTLSYWRGGPLVTKTIGAAGAPISVEDYLLAGATSCGTSPQDAIVVLAHELGHALGLPDLYDTSLGYQPQQRKWVLGCWGLMAGGAWNCPTVDGMPPPLSAWSSSQLGWSQPDRRPLREQHLLLGEQRAAAVSLGNGQELWLEQRHWDAAAGWPSGSGSLVYRVAASPDGAIRPVEVIEADSDQALSKPEVAGGDRGRASDALTPGGSVGVKELRVTAQADDGGKSSLHVQLAQ